MMFIQLNLKYFIHHPLKDINGLTKEDQIYTSVVILLFYLMFKWQFET